MYPIACTGYKFKEQLNIFLGPKVVSQLVEQTIYPSLYVSVANVGFSSARLFLKTLWRLLVTP